MNKSVLVDVRSVDEFGQSHKDGAVNIPVENIMYGKLGIIGSLPKESEIQLYCLSGSRAELAKDILEQFGYTNVTNIGGFKG